MNMRHSSFGKDGEADSAASGQNHRVVSPLQTVSVFGQMIRMRCIRRREISIEDLASESGVHLSRIRKFLRNDEAARGPSLSEALSIWAVLGPSAASKSLASIGMTVSDEEGAEANLGIAIADLFTAGAQLAHIAADGAIERDEADQAERAADICTERVEVFRQQARKAKGAR